MKQISCVVLTGKMSAARSNIESHYRQMGLIVDDRVTNRTDALVVGKRPGKTKLSAAQRMGCQVIHEEDFSIALKNAKAEPPMPEAVEPPKVEPLGRQSWMDKLDTDRSVKF